MKFDFKTCKRMAETLRRVVHAKFCELVAAVLKHETMQLGEGTVPLEKARDLHQIFSRQFGITGGYKPSHQELNALLKPVETALRSGDRLVFLCAVSKIASVFTLRLSQVLPKQAPGQSRAVYESAYLGTLVRLTQHEGLILSKLITAYSLECRRRSRRRPAGPSAEAPSLPEDIGKLMMLADRMLQEFLCMLAAEFLDDGDLSFTLAWARELHLRLSRILPRLTKGSMHGDLGEMLQPLETAIKTRDRFGFLVEIGGIAKIFQTAVPLEPSSCAPEASPDELKLLQEITTSLWFQMKGLMFARLFTACALRSKRRHDKR